MARQSEVARLAATNVVPCPFVLPVAFPVVFFGYRQPDAPFTVLAYHATGCKVRVVRILMTFTRTFV